MQQPRPQKVPYHQKSDLSAGFNFNQTTLWLGGLETWEDEAYLYYILQQLLPRYCTISNITVVRDPATEVSLGYGFIDFTTHQAAETALQICRKNVRPGHTRPFRIAWAASNTFSHKRSSSTMLSAPAPVQTQVVATQRTQYQATPGQLPLQQNVLPTPNDENLTLYVTPLERHITKFTLAEELKNFGYKSIISIKIAHNENGVSRGFGFIRFGNRDEWNDALERLKTLRLGENQQPLHVTVARSNSYDPEHTVANEMLFGKNVYSNYRHPSESMTSMPNKKQRRNQYWSMPPNTVSVPPQQHMIDMNTMSGMMMPKTPAATYPYPLVSQGVTTIPTPPNTAVPNGMVPNYMASPITTAPAYQTTYMPTATQLPSTIISAPQIPMYLPMVTPPLSKQPAIVNPSTIQAVPKVSKQPSPVAVISKPPTTPGAPQADNATLSASIVFKPPALNATVQGQLNEVVLATDQSQTMYSEVINSSSPQRMTAEQQSAAAAISPNTSQTETENAQTTPQHKVDSQVFDKTEQENERYTSNILDHSQPTDGGTHTVLEAVSSSSSEGTAQFISKDTGGEHNQDYSELPTLCLQTTETTQPQTSSQ